MDWALLGIPVLLSLVVCARIPKCTRREEEAPLLEQFKDSEDEGENDENVSDVGNDGNDHLLVT